MRPGRWCATIAAAGMIVAVLLPLSAALPASEARQARFIGAALTTGVCAALAFARGGRPRLWSTVSIVAAAAALVLLLLHIDANSRCVASYAGRTVLIGRDYTPSAADYVNQNPGLSAPDLLLDAGGVAERVWTPASIASCRFWLGSGALLALPLFAIAVGVLIVRRDPFSPGAPRSMVKSRPLRPAVVYDAFLSYRHTEPDRTQAEDILTAVESHGLRVAIDFRDFAPNQHLVSEMERCIRQSRFVLCVVTSRYLDSDHCSEEAIISKTLDLADRRKRLVPLVFEPVDLPVWLHGLVGIDFTPRARVDPIARLLGVLAPAAADRTAAQTPPDEKA